MLGEQIGETTGRRLVRRVLSVEPATAEVTFEDSGHMLGVPTTGIGTYTSVVRADGSIFGQGQGISTTSDGEGVTWTGLAWAILARVRCELPWHVVFPDHVPKARPS